MAELNRDLKSRIDNLAAVGVVGVSATNDSPSFFLEVEYEDGSASTVHVENEDVLDACYQYFIERMDQAGF